MNFVQEGVTLIHVSPVMEFRAIGSLFCHCPGISCLSFANNVLRSPRVVFFRMMPYVIGVFQNQTNMEETVLLNKLLHKYPG